MRCLLSLVALLCVACNPVSDAREECQDVIDETIPPIVDEVLAECARRADEAADQCAQEIGQAIDDMKTWAEEQIQHVQNEADSVLLSAGCVKVNDVWDCGGACQP